MSHYIVTISRESGSGGRKIGKLLAEKLNWNLYDKELLDMTAAASGSSPEIVANAEHAHSTYFSMALAHGPEDVQNYRLPFNDQLYVIESNLIRDIANRENAVIVGRCADVALEDYPNTINIFIQGSREKRIARVMKRENLPHDEAEKVMKRIDSTRMVYHDYYATTKWGKRENYDLIINSDNGEEKTAAALYSFVTEMTR